MILYTYRFDATCIKIAAFNQEEADEILMNEFKSITKRDDKLYQRWDASYEEDVRVESKPIEKGILSIVSH